MTNQKFMKFIIHSRKNVDDFGWNFEIWAVQKYVNLADFIKSFQTSIHLQKSASIQPRTGPSNFAKISQHFEVKEELELT